MGLKEPAPPLHTPVVVGPLTIPDKAVAGLLAQENKAAPASTVGAAVKVM